MTDDRTVHASSADMEVIFDGKVGKWYLEPKGDLPRQRVTVMAAAEYAAWLLDRGVGQVHFGLPGGSRFDQYVRRRYTGMDL